MENAASYFIRKDEETSEEVTEDLNMNEESHGASFQAPIDSSAPPISTQIDDRFNLHRLAVMHGERKRARTESLCSNKSTAISKDLQKIRRPDDLKPSGRQIPNRAAILKKEKSMLTMKDMIYYNPQTNPMPKPKKPDETEIKVKTEIKEERSKSPTPAYEPPKSQSGPIVPQLKLGPNGEMILDEQSLVVQSSADLAAKQLFENSPLYYDDGSSGKYGYFKRQKRTKDWSSEETVRFYRCLHTVGTDFSLMLQLFPNRSRRDLKIKFKKEEKNNSQLVDKALLHPKEFDIEALQREFDEEDAEERTKAEVNASEKKILRKRRKDEIKKIKKAAPQKELTRVARNLTEVDAVYEAVDKSAAKRRRRSSSTAETSAELVIDDETEIVIDEAQEIVVDNEDTGARFTVRVLDEELEDADARSESEADKDKDDEINDDQEMQIEPPTPSKNFDDEDIELSRLVVCAAHDTNGAVTYQVHMMDKKTGELSKEPLDLAPDEVEKMLPFLK